MQSEELEGKKVASIGAGFAGRVVSLAGNFATMTRAGAQKLLTEAGATVVSGVTPTTDLVIYGMNGERLVEKARSQGVALMDEAEMRALLLAPRPAAPAFDAAEVGRVVAELRAFVASLEKRGDVEVAVAALGRPASEDKLAQLRAQRVADEVVGLYAEVDGVHIEWRFVEPPGGGCMRIPAVSQWSRFADDGSHYMNFGEDSEAMLLDEITPEGSTWLVRTRGRAGGEIRFASAAEGRDGVLAGTSIVDYLRRAMDHGMVPYWPRCFRSSGDVSYASEERAALRFRAAPVAPTPIVAGGRVQFRSFSEGGRGQALELREVPTSDASASTGTRFVKVRADEGSIAWIPRRLIKGLAGSDAYERLRAPEAVLAPEDGELEGLLAELNEAIDPTDSYSTHEQLGLLPGNARRAAGLLGARPLSDAVALVLALDHAVARAQLDRQAGRPLERIGGAFDPGEVARFGSYTIAGLLAGMYAGLVVLAHHASARRGVPGAALLEAELVEQLAGHAAATELHERCTRTAPLAAPRWCGEGPEAAALGLSADAPLWSGAGF